MRRIALVLTLAAAALSVADYLGWRANHRLLLALADESGLSERQPDLAGELAQARVARRATTRLAWALLDLEIDRGWLAELPPDEQLAEDRRGLERLELARRLAAETLPGRPASWQAATVLGASRYLLAQRNRRQDQPTAAWREPLLAAMRLAPAYSEPPILLAAEYLSRWSSLSPTERGELLPVLGRAFEDARGLRMLIPSWVRLAPSLGRLLEPIPDRPWAWEQVGREFLRGGDLERFAIVRHRWLDAMPAYLAERVERARARQRGGDARAAAKLLRSVIATPPDRRFAASLSAALAALPEEVEADHSRPHLHNWLRWALDLCLLGDCPLEAATLARLTGLLEDLEGAEVGLAALAAGDLAAAGRLEPEAGEAGAPEWNRYWIFKAGLLAGSDTEEARRSLARVSRRPQDELLYWRAAVRLADAAGESAALATARGELALHSGDRRPAEAWLRRGWASRLELLTRKPYGGLRLQLRGIPAKGAAVELRWDGRAVAVAALQPNESLLWRQPVTPGPHLIEVAVLSGRPVTPTELSLLAASAAE